MPRGVVWQPANFDHVFRGDVTLRYAIEQSLNVPFARLGLAVGLDRVVAMAHALGVDGTLAPVPSLSLGASETHAPRDDARVRDDRGGRRASARRVATAVRDADGHAIEIDTAEARASSPPTRPSS